MPTFFLFFFSSTCPYHPYTTSSSRLAGSLTFMYTLGTFKLIIETPRRHNPKNLRKLLFESPLNLSSRLLLFNYFSLFFPVSLHHPLLTDSLIPVLCVTRRCIRIYIYMSLRRLIALLRGESRENKWLGFEGC